LKMEKVVEKALKRSTKASKLENLPKRTLKVYQNEGNDGKVNAENAITVAIFAANIATRKVEFLPSDMRVVDALMAATAIVPLFPAVEVPEGTKTSFYIDGENVNADPLWPTLKFLQSKVKTRALKPDSIRLYSSVAFPISQNELPGPKDYRGLVGVTLRSLELQRFQNASLGRKLIKLYHDTIQIALEKKGQKGAVLEREQNGEERNPFLAAKVISIEADRALRLNDKIPFARSHEKRRSLIDEAVADGCRATLTAWLTDENEKLFEVATKSLWGKDVIPCRGLVFSYLQAENKSLARPESSNEFGPGLSEICRACRFFQDRTASDGTPLPKLSGFKRLKKKKNGTGNDVQNPVSTEPLNKNGTVSLLFSGGVFRGVYQLGVANALNILNLRPNVVAGASVGAITAALLAELFHDPCPKLRRLKMCQLASTYLALDRLIVTDRFYDFVRKLTLRGGTAEFSPRDLDLLLRRYDENAPGDFSVGGRKTIAGLERLFYLSPFELYRLVQLHRSRNYGELFRLLLFEHLQELLDRNGAALEVLGSEPLDLLLKEYVPRCRERMADFDLYKEKKDDRRIYLLATVTNLTKGRLQTLGSPYVGEGDERPILGNGLLASSAFPGVFRPRNSWEIFPTSSEPCQYVDGGVMDNLPFDSVIRFLDELCKPQGEKKTVRYPRRPTTPHLIIAASLEPECEELEKSKAKEVQECWVSLFRRARKIRYNRKIDIFATAQRDISEIWSLTGFKPGEKENEPLGIEIAAVKPKWLCGTFAFHPMLGFSRRRQAASIAHGCASTLTKMRELWTDSKKSRPGSDFWGMDRGIAEAITSKPTNHGPGKCWFSPKVECPFSKRALDEVKRDFDQDSKREEVRPFEVTREALELIYEECGKRKTHEPQSASIRARGHLAGFRCPPWAAIRRSDGKSSRTV
jgi:predicted acylesterase/phospholipase RssA